jgi:DNA-directed RNA polymerase specialized sigma24 family protein
MAYRKFYYGDMVRIGPRYAIHANHIGQVSGTRIHQYSYRHSRVTYVVECECGSTIRPHAYKISALEDKRPHNIEEARMDHWFNDEVGVPTPEDAETRLAESLSTLTDREQEILSSRYAWNGHSHKSVIELGQDFGVSTARIQQIEHAARRKMRARIQGGANGYR